MYRLSDESGSDGTGFDFLGLMRSNFVQLDMIDFTRSEELFKRGFYQDRFRLKTGYFATEDMIVGVDVHQEKFAALLKQMRSIRPFPEPSLNPCDIPFDEMILLKVDLQVNIYQTKFELKKGRPQLLTNTYIAETLSNDPALKDFLKRVRQNAPPLLLPKLESRYKLSEYLKKSRKHNKLEDPEVFQEAHPAKPEPIEPVIPAELPKKKLQTKVPRKEQASNFVPADAVLETVLGSQQSGRKIAHSVSTGLPEPQPEPKAPPAVKIDFSQLESVKEERVVVTARIIGYLPDATDLVVQNLRDKLLIRDDFRVYISSPDGHLQYAVDFENTRAILRFFNLRELEPDTASRIDFKIIQAISEPVETGFKNKFGAHVGMGGGIYNAVTNAMNVGSNSFALFLKNPKRWVSPMVSDEDASKFIELCKEYNFNPRTDVLPHGSYFINLANPDPEKAKQSLECFVDDLVRCEKLNIGHYNFHPGSSLGSDHEESLKRLAANINQAIERTSFVKIVIENMAGHGNLVGGELEDIQKVIALVDNKNRVGVCVDTCHTFAAGYDLRDEEAWDKFWKEFDTKIGAQYLSALHINDSKAPLGANRDLHQRLGWGFLGLECFRLLANDSRFENIPLILEVPVEPKDDSGFGEDIKLLEWLVGKSKDDKEVIEKSIALQKLGEKERKEQLAKFEKKKAKPAPKRAKGQATLTSITKKRKVEVKVGPESDPQNSQESTVQSKMTVAGQGLVGQKSSCCEHTREDGHPAGQHHGSVPFTKLSGRTDGAHAGRAQTHDCRVGKSVQNGITIDTLDAASVRRPSQPDREIDCRRKHSEEDHDIVATYAVCKNPCYISAQNSRCVHHCNCCVRCGLSESNVRDLKSTDFLLRSYNLEKNRVIFCVGVVASVSSTLALVYLSLIRKLDIASKDVQINANILMPHLNPTVENNLFSNNGNTIPPTDPPSVATPKALDRLRRNQ
ncbi:hypothetical protein OGAPHI_007212 [Ogataea philodendri]|uniref:Apurinic-apyrimidinic endonuclease 1 n=1 Tax=Ogataea philodendri TaxID=1378263 RepID=A0A9P8NV90_9ASCO|nr:uncharacterized protein OGAPHI_007212 [Ogataea philodendri]KAH3660007.1 hypothetical protein OGAPHI_007212 [Ogataea philodendri]